ncbi:hypothetical protein [Streptomyces sp. ISL-94]|uniref:hypothetical protein n=1 Tax=Streptomyces sp. ISL-94 TaxID=2819190 RepID=UPI001BEC9B01|nr:hypothetical protein [Streptomyces sp. ISL-94]MBT2482360.1 hypothetical protein [Streptomyces sp. ISL-94]
MSEHGKHPLTAPPSKAPGESGDREAREEAENAVMPGTKDGEAADALTPNTQAQRRTADRNRDPDRGR